MIKSILAGFSLIAIASAALPMPVTVQNCGRDITFEEVPNRAVSSDVNLTEIMLALGLEDRMVGYAGISDLRRLGPEFLDAASRLVALSPRYPTREILLGAGADFYFAGWNYGLRLGGELTPDSLERLGIKAYVLTESCIHVTEKSRASMDDLYTDIRNLGKIFGIEAKAEALIGRFKDEIANIVDSVDTPAGPKPRVFVYDSGQDVPFTAGRYAMPNALIEGSRGCEHDVRFRKELGHRHLGGSCCPRPRGDHYRRLWRGYGGAEDRLPASEGCACQYTRRKEPEIRDT